MLYPLHPITEDYAPLERSELAKMRESIRSVGLRQPIVVWRKWIVDGRHRGMLCDQLGIELGPANFIDISDYSEDEMRKHVQALNEHRRSRTTPMSNAEKQALVKQAIADNPNGSNRQIAREVGVHHQMVAKSRVDDSSTPDQPSEPKRKKDEPEMDAEAMKARVLRFMDRHPEATRREIALHFRIRTGSVTKILGTDPDDRRNGREFFQPNPELPKVGRPYHALVVNRPPGTEGDDDAMLVRLLALTPEIESMVMEDCALWLWFDNISHAAAVCQQWGFRPQGLFTWIRAHCSIPEKKAGWHDPLYCLLAFRGQPHNRFHGSVAFEARVRAKADRPLEFYGLVETITPGRNYADCFGSGIPRGTYWYRT